MISGRYDETGWKRGLGLFLQPVSATASNLQLWDYFYVAFNSHSAPLTLHIRKYFKIVWRKNPFLWSLFKYFSLFNRTIARVWSDAFIPKLRQLSEAESDQADPWDHCQLKMWSCAEYFHPNIRTLREIIRLINGSSTAISDSAQAQLLNKFG